MQSPAAQQVPYSIVGRLAWRIGLLAVGGLGLFALLSWSAAYWLIAAEQQAYLSRTVGNIQNIARAGHNKGGEAGLRSELALYASRRPDTRLEMRKADGSVLYADPAEPPFLLSERTRAQRFEVGALPANAVLRMDIEQNARSLDRLALILAIGVLLGGAVAAALGRLLARRGLAPVGELAERTRAIAPQRLDERLVLARPVAELQPWIDQFNALLARTDAAYRQLEGFNADVAHELRTPLTAVIGQMEVALSRERDADSLRETMLLCLERLHGLGAMVSDMLFLSRADRGAIARRGTPTSLATLAQQVAEFHEAALQERQLSLRVNGDAVLALDEGLVKRALSNLIGNATRYADAGSAIEVGIESVPGGATRVAVSNLGPAIDAKALPRLFDRFYRADTARADADQHHGLGLAIVAAIARMHGGETFAHSEAGRTEVGFSLAGPPAGN